MALLVDRFRSRFQAELLQQLCFRMLDESVLRDLPRDGPSPAITRRIATLATLAADAGADLIVCTCSSTSPAIDAARKQVPVPIVKIDDAMYAEAARTDGRVGLVCTTRSTLEPSRSPWTSTSRRGHARGGRVRSGRRRVRRAVRRQARTARCR